MTARASQHNLHWFLYHYAPHHALQLHHNMPCCLNTSGLILGQSCPCRLYGYIYPARNAELLKLMQARKLTVIGESFCLPFTWARIAFRAIGHAIKYLVQYTFSGTTRENCQEEAFLEAEVSVTSFEAEVSVKC